MTLRYRQQLDVSRVPAGTLRGALDPSSNVREPRRDSLCRHAHSLPKRAGGRERDAGGWTPGGPDAKRPAIASATAGPCHLFGARSGPRSGQVTSKVTHCETHTAVTLSRFLAGVNRISEATRCAASSRSAFPAEVLTSLFSTRPCSFT